MGPELPSGVPFAIATEAIKHIKLKAKMQTTQRETNPEYLGAAISPSLSKL
ncbi:hypothetical protein SBDP1_70002 [Syntrophobacter sp. SbD1]|nr:hypothetical protein SBDP1_70002 [Syntrophobacter sp. SbD1]